MRKLIILLFASIFSFSCTKESESVQFRKSNILLNDQEYSSKIKQKVNDLTLIGEFNSKTGEFTLTSNEKILPLLFVRYQSYKGKTLTLNSSTNFGKYISPFVVSNYSSVPFGSKYKVNVQVRTTTGSNFEFLYKGVK